MVNLGNHTDLHSLYYNDEPMNYDDATRYYAREIRSYCGDLSQRQTWLLGFLFFNFLSLAVLVAVSTINLIFIFPVLVSVVFCFGIVFELKRIATQILSVRIMLKKVIHLHELSNQARKNSERTSADAKIISNDVELAIRAHAALDPDSEGAKSIFRLFTPI